MNYPSLFEQDVIHTPAQHVEKKRRVALTSIAAYQSTKREPLQDRVYNALQALGEASMRDVARRLGAEINSITPRFHELEHELKRIAPTGQTKRDPVTHKSVKTYRVVMPTNS